MHYTKPESLISLVVNIGSYVNSVLAKLKGSGIRKVLLVTGCVMLSVYSDLIAQYTSVANGNWNTNTTWSPVGIPGASDNVIISGGHNVIVTANAACTSITFVTDAANNTLNINSGISLAVSGAITIPRAGGGFINTLAVGGGNLNTGSIAFTSGGATVRHLITISTGVVTVTGNVSQSGSTGSASISFSGTGLLKLGGTFLTAATGTLTQGTGTVEYNSTIAQTVGNFTYNNLTISNSGTKALFGNTVVDGTLTMNGGDISTGANTLTINNSAAASLNYSSGIIIGKLERFINQTAQNYFFPVGIVGQIHSLNANFVNLTAGSLLVQYNSGDPGNSGLPLIDGDGSQVTNEFTSGYWSALAKNSLVSTNYNLNLNATGFGPYTINAGTRILTRTDAGGSWILNGSHSDAAGSIIKRTGLTGIYNSGSGTQFGIASSGARITSQPSNQSVCENATASFSVIATGHPVLTYSWYKAPGTPLIEGGRFTGTNLPTLNIANVISADAGSYYCIVTDGYGNAVQTNSALLTVNTLPTNPTVINGVRCGTGTVTLQSGGAGGAENYKWYDALAGGNLVQTNGSTFLTPSISSTTTYYVTKYNTTSLCESSPRTMVVATINEKPAAALGYKYQKTLLIDHTKVSGGSDLLNFPVLINISSSPARDELKARVNGGHVENSSGFDIIFTDANYNKLDHQVESYDPVTGNLVAWVRLPVLSSSGDTHILMLYGNPQINLDPSVKSVWDPNFRGVWHLSGLDFSDASLNSNNGTNFGSVDVPGKIANGKSFNGTTSYINAGNNSSLFINNSITVSAWVNSAGGDGHILNMGGGWSRPGYSLFWYGGNIRDELQNTTTPEKLFTDVTGPSTGSWHYIAFTWDIGSTLINTYIDGVLRAPIDANVFIGPIGNPIQNLDIGKNEDPAAFGLFNGVIDEARVQSISRSAGWIVTEYNNQNIPDNFYTVGGEGPCSVFTFNGLCSGATITYSVPNTPTNSYTWSVIGGNASSTTGNSITVTWNATGPYSIQLTESEGTCSGSSLLYNVVVSSQPVAQSIVQLPNIQDVCTTGTVSATFTGGSGGFNPVDVYESSVDGGLSWQAYIPGSLLSSASVGANRLQIQTKRTTSGNGCTESGWTIVKWNIVAQPSWDTYSFPTVNLCSGGQVTFSASIKDGLGGTLTWIRSISSGGAGVTVTSPDIPPIGTYYYRPHFAPAGQGCNLSDGTETIVTVQVDPTWNVITPPATNICAGGSLTFSATLNNAGSGTVQWVRSGTSMGPGTVVTSPDAPGVGTYFYRPQYIPGYGGCNLADGIETLVTVNPYSVLTSTLTPSPICNGSLFSYSPISDIGGTSFSWNRASIVGITPVGPTSGTGDPNEILNNTTASPISVRYIYTLTANGCTNPANFNVDVIVNPTAVITSAATANWCNNVSNTYTATSSSSTAAFSWTRAVVAGISNLAGSGNSAAITETLVNTTAEPVVVHYLITPGVNGCSGTTFDAAVTVNPTAVITSAATANWCKDRKSGV